MSSAVKLLCHFDGADGSTTFTDSSASGHVGTALGSAAIQNAIAEFSGAVSLNPSGDTGDAVSFPYSEDFQLGDNDFCLEFWIYFTAGGTMIPFDNRGTTDGTCWAMYTDGSNFHFVASPHAEDNAGWPLNVSCPQPAPGAWHHIAITRVTDTFTFYIDGGFGSTQNVPAGWTIPYNVGNAFYVGRGKPGLSVVFPFQGYIDDLRLTVGNAVYFSAFTPSGPLTTTITAAANLDVTQQFGIVSELGTPALNITHQFGVASYSDDPIFKLTHQFGIMSYRDDPSFKVTHMFGVLSMQAPINPPTVVTINDTQVSFTVPHWGGTYSQLNLQKALASAPTVWATDLTHVVPGTTVVDNTLTGDTVYIFRIVAIDGMTTIPGTPTSDVTTAPPPPTGVLLTPSTGPMMSITITYTPVDDTVGINVYRATSFGGSYDLIGADVFPSPYIDTHSLTELQPYYYALTALDSSGNESLLPAGIGPVTITTTTGDHMNERATVYEGSQLFVETTPGVTGAATFRLMETDFMPDITPDIREIKVQGSKFDTDTSHGKEYTTGTIGGHMAYYDDAYLFSGLLCSPAISTPVSNTWNVGNASGTIGFDVTTHINGSAVTTTLAAASFANASALQAAIGALTNVGVGNVTVTGAAPSYVVSGVAWLSTGTFVLSNPTGTPLPTLAVAYTATNTRRFTFDMIPFGPEASLQTYTLEKGAPGIANFGQQIGQLTPTALMLKMSEKEMTKTGNFIGVKGVDPFTVTPLTDITDKPSMPMNSSDVGIFLGTSLVGLQRQKRVFDMEWGCTDRQTPVITLDDSVDSFSNTVESAQTKWTQKMTMAQDTNGQTVLGYLRSGQIIYRVIEIRGPSIESGFRHRFKITEAVKVIAGPKQDTNGVYTGAYESTLILDPTLMGGNAVRVEIDVELTAL